MAQSGPIIIVDDDPDDQDMIERIINQMKIDNTIKKFFDGQELLNFLRSAPEKPLLIICDINMPIVNGLQVKEEIEKDVTLKKQRIPFVFLSTTGYHTQVTKAYEFCIQGFFVKGQSYEALKGALHIIISYWRMAVHIQQP